MSRTAIHFVSPRSDGHAWSDRYFTKMQFHDDVSVPPVAPGELGRRYLERIRFITGSGVSFRIENYFHGGQACFRFSQQVGRGGARIGSRG